MPVQSGLDDESLRELFASLGLILTYPRVPNRTCFSMRKTAVRARMS